MDQKLCFLKPERNKLETFGNPVDFILKIFTLKSLCILSYMIHKVS